MRSWNYVFNRVCVYTALPHGDYMIIDNESVFYLILVYFSTKKILLRVSMRV